MMKTNESWKWLFQPLAPAMRKRLEVTLGVVLSGAAVVVLSSVIRPDPSKLAPPVETPPLPSMAEQHVQGAVFAEPPMLPKVSPLFAAAVARDDIEAMEKLHVANMPVDGMIAVAAESGSMKALPWLLEHGGDIHEDEGSFDSPMLLADERPDVVAWLREHGAAEPTLSNAAHAAATNAIVRLLDAKTPVNPSGDFPLQEAVSTTRGTFAKRLFIVERLLAAGADPNREEADPLTAAVNTCEPPTDGQTDVQSTDCMTMVKLLVKRGARTRGETITATFSIDDSMRDAMLDAVLRAKIDRGATAFALNQGYGPSPQAIKKIVAKGVDWAWHDGEEDAALPLLSAVQRADRDFVKAMLDAGAPANTHYKDATCPLGEAIDGIARSGGADYARIVELLVARGADVNRRLPDGRTPLFAAAEAGDLRVVNVLLEHGARVNDLVLDDTALDAAESSGHTPVARVLHSRGGRRAPKPNP